MQPTVSIQLADTRLTIGETTTVTFTFTFNTPVTGFTLDDISLARADGTLGALTPNADRTVWSATFTPAADTRSTPYSIIRVNLGGVTSDTGETGVGTASSGFYTVDTQRPGATITLADTNLAVGEATTVTFTFSEFVRGFSIDDIDLGAANGQLGPLMADAENLRIWRATFTPRANTQSADNRISVNLAGVTDMQGNAGEGRASSASYQINTTAPRPSVTITLDDYSLSVGDTATVTFTFNQPVTRFTFDDLVLTDANGTLDALSSQDGGTTWTAKFTPTADITDATNTIGVKLDGVTNAAGHAGEGRASSANYQIDTVRPSVTITLADNHLSVGETTTVTFAFSEPVTGFTQDDIDLSDANGTLGALTADADGKTWRATFTPKANTGDATNRIGVKPGSVTDAAGNTGPPAKYDGTNILGDNYTVDTTGERPGVSIALSSRTLKIGDTATVTFTFSEPVTGFTTDDIVTTGANGTLGALTADADGRTWRATFTPTANTEDNSSHIDVNLAGVSNAAGRAGLGVASSARYQVDTTRPTATITLTDINLAAGESSTVTFSFSEPVTGFTQGDIDLGNANGTLGALTADADGKTWRATFTPTANISDTTNRISVNLGGVADAAGNTGSGQATSANYRINTTVARPTVTITLADTSLTGGETTTVTFSFSEPVTGFTLDDIDLGNANGSLGALRAGNDASTWSATFTPTANISDSTNTISVNLGGVTNAASNTGTGRATSGNYSIDTTGLAATITLADTTLTAGKTTTVTFSFNQSVNGFTQDDIDLTHANGRLGPLTANADRTVWRATFTPDADARSSPYGSISLNLGGVTNDAGNTGTGQATSSPYLVDTQRPTATITLADTNLTAGQTTTTTVTFTFSEFVTGFTLDDIDLGNANGTLGALTADADGRTWRATFTPTANVSDTTNRISVNLGGITDAAGNTGTGSATSGNYSIDTTRPTVTITLADTSLTAGQTTTVTFSFSEFVTGFTLDDIDLGNANGTLGALTADADGRTWRATFTPTANVSDTTNRISVNLGGVTDATGNSGTGSATSDNYSIDTTRSTVTATITLADYSLTAGETTTVTFSFSEPVTGFTLDDIDLGNANGSLGALTADADGRTWRATFTPTANVSDTTNRISVNLGGVTDATGNSGTGSATSGNYSIDTVAPVLASATVNANQLVLSYTEGSSLDSRHIPPSTAFTVRIEGVPCNVATVEVDAQAKTVTLTLTRAVAYGQQVSVAYNDPTSGNDSDAIQDAAGNDAASFPDTPVRNTTAEPPPQPAPAEAAKPSPSPSPPPQPAPAEPTKPNPSTPPKHEPPGIPGPNGAAPVAGDGNADGIKDSEQPAVGSISAVTSPAGGSNSANETRTSITLVAGSQDGKLIPGSNANITSLEQKSAPSNPPRGLEMPVGTMNFKVTLAADRSSETFSLYVDPALGVNGYWVQDRSGTWVNLASTPYSGKMATESERLRLDFQIEDGGQFDADGKVDGVITAPGAVAHMQQLSIVGHAPDSQDQGHWF